MNPFVQKALDTVHKFPEASATISQQGSSLITRQLREKDWIIKRHPRSGGILVDDRFRVQIQTKNGVDGSDSTSSRAVMEDVFAIGDTAVIDQKNPLPATAQVANQEALVWNHPA